MPTLPCTKSTGGAPSPRHLSSMDGYSADHAKTGLAPTAASSPARAFPEAAGARTAFNL